MKNPDPNLWRVFHHYNRKHFGGKLKKPIMLRYSQVPDESDSRVMGLCTEDNKGLQRIILNEKLRGHPGFVRLTLVHEMVHLLGYQSGWSSRDNDCCRLKSKFHRKMLKIVRQEPDLI